MNEMILFKNDEIGVSIRTITIDGIIWFAAKDVADYLEYSETEKMTRRLDDDEKMKFTAKPLSQGVGLECGENGNCNNVTITLINESGLYNAVLGSKKTESKLFKKWVTSEVLPSIRKTGKYSMIDNTKLPQTYGEALLEYAKVVYDLEKKELALKEAIKTKAYISDKKTATAMNTASQLSKENSKLLITNEILKVELDESGDYATIKKVEYHFKKTLAWKPLKQYSIAHNLEIRKIADVNYPEGVNAYHKEAWLNVYNIDITKIKKKSK